jgi:sec-independent protein translocase protein TatA
MLGLDNPIHLAFVLVLLLLVFGAKRLPEMGRSLGSGLRGFKESISGEHDPTQQLAAAPTVSTMAAAQPAAAPTATTMTVAQPAAAPVSAAAPVVDVPRAGTVDAVDAVSGSSTPNGSPVESAL